MIFNIAEKLKSIGKFCSWFSPLLCIVYGIFSLWSVFTGKGNDDVLFEQSVAVIFAWLAAAFGGYLIGLLLYGFGQLIENTTPQNSKEQSASETEEQLASTALNKCKEVQKEPCTNENLVISKDFLIGNCARCEKSGVIRRVFVRKKDQAEQEVLSLCEECIEILKYEE